MGQVISVVSQKGGVGKTTTVINLASCLAEKKRVLIVDLDSQGNATLDMGLMPTKLDAEKKTIIYALIGTKPLQDMILLDNPAIIPAGQSLVSVELPSTNVLREKLKPLLTEYDYILIDCAPTLTRTTAAALNASDYVLVPIDLDIKSFAGIGQLFATIAEVKQRGNPSLSIIGVLPTRYQKRHKHDQAMLERLKKILESRYKVFTPIPETTNVKKASRASQPLIRFMPRARGVKEYYDLAEYIVNHGK
ncbi:MAG: ParA family protein [Trueperaceae bacterium]|nr:ParA family protein [Trueperaceae bacterium]